MSTALQILLMILLFLPIFKIFGALLNDFAEIIFSFLVIGLIVSGLIKFGFWLYEVSFKYDLDYSTFGFVSVLVSIVGISFFVYRKNKYKVNLVKSG